ncbi:hypothetical protein FS837_009403 [Tulasnella sp. UAMH 9824]|nr:hypothetical protein FS837_009403 [Tulasnella sp. UAMH 9824]
MTAQSQHSSPPTNKDAVVEMNGLALPLTNAGSNDSASQKREYLKRLRHEELVDLLISVDADRATKIFPDDLQAAISTRSTELVEEDPVATPPSPTEPEARTASPPNHQGAQPATSSPPPFSPAQHQHIPLHSSLPVPGNPFMPFLPPHLPHPPFPFPFHQGPGVSAMPPPPPPPVQLHQGLVSQPPPHAITSSTDAQPPHPQTPPVPSPQEPTSPSSTPTPHYAGPVEPLPPTAHSSSSLNNGMPSYEEMICMALADLASPDGSAPKAVFEWMTNRFPLMTNFRPSAHQALQKAFKRGRLQKVGNKYRLNPNWSGGSTSRRTTRRPQAAGGAPPPAIPFSARVPGISGSWPVAPPTQALPPGQAHPDGVLQPGAVGLPASTGPAPFPHPPPFPHPHHPAENPSNPHNGPVAPIPSVIPAASALLQAIAGINGIIDRSQSEVSQPEGEGDTEAQGRESDREREPESTANGVVAIDEGDDDAEGETVEGRSSREATEGRDGTSPDRQPVAGGLDHSRDNAAVTNLRHNSDDPEELRSALFLLVDQLQAAAAASAHA